MNLKDKAVSGIKWTSMGTIIITGLQLAQLLILSRLLAPKDFGLIAIVNVIITLIRSFSDLGISAAVIHYQKTTKEQISALYSLNIIMGFLLFFLLLLSLPIIMHFYNEPVLSGLLLVAGLSLFISPFGSLFQVLFQKDLQFNLLTIQDLTASIISFSIIIFLALWGLGVWALAIGQVVQSVMKALLLSWVGFRKFEMKMNFDFSNIKDYLRFGFYQLGERTVNFLAERIDQILIGYLLGPISLGYYYFAFNLVNQPLLIINPIFTKVAFPLLAKVQDQKLLLKKIYLKILNYVSLINAPILFGLLTLSPLGVPLIFGDKWNQSIGLIQILSLVSLLRGIANPTGSILLAKGRVDLGFKWNVILLLISVPAIFVSGKIGNAIGISIALLLIQILFFYPSYLFLVKPFLGKCFKDYLYSSLKPILISTLMSLFIIAPTYFNYKIKWIYIFSIQLMIAIISYITIMVLIEKKTLIELKGLIFGKN